jgi:hypothetical protein
MGEKIIVVLGDSFDAMSPRMQRLNAERLVAAAGIRKPSLLRRVLRWFGLAK